MVFVTVGCLLMALAGSCTLGFFGMSGLAFLHDIGAPPPQHYSSGYDLLVLLGSVPVGAVGVGVGLFIFWAALSFDDEKGGTRWMRRALVLLGGLWSAMAALAAVAAAIVIIRNPDAGAVGACSVILLLVVAPGVLMLLAGTSKRWGGGRQ